MNFRSWGAKLGAVALGSVLWVHAITEQSFDREVLVRLVVQDPETTPESKPIVALLLGKDGSHVKVRVAGTGKNLLQMDIDDYVLKVKTQGHVGGNRTYLLSVGQIEYASVEKQVQFEEIIYPKEISVYFDRLVEKDVPIEVDANISSAIAHLIVGQPEVEPVIARLVGPRSLLDTIYKVRPDTFSLSGLREDVDITLDLQSGLSKYVTVNPPSVNFFADIQIIAENKVSNVPINVRGNSGTGFRIVPQNVVVKIRGGVDVVSQIAPASDLGLYVDYRTGDESVVDVKSDLIGSNFEILSIHPNQVEIVRE